MLAIQTPNHMIGYRMKLPVMPLPVGLNGSSWFSWMISTMRMFLITTWTRLVDMKMPTIYKKPFVCVSNRAEAEYIRTHLLMKHTNSRVEDNLSSEYSHQYCKWHTSRSCHTYRARHPRHVKLRKVGLKTRKG